MMASDAPINRSGRGALQHLPNQNRPLTKSQQQLNRLTQKVESLKQDIEEETARMEQLQSLYNDEVLPLYAAVAEQRYKLAQALARASERYPFNRQQRSYLSATIVTLCKQVFDELEVTPEMEAFFDRWSNETYREEQAQLLAQAKQQFADFMYDRYGMDIDVEDIEDTTEGFEQFRRRMFRQQEEERRSFWQQQADGANSRRQKQQEEARKAAEAIQQKSIRSLYITLVKVLHPDMESDPDQKREKEELMKQVTQAYEQNDLQTLLRLELQWVHSTTGSIERLTDEALRVYTEALKQQVSELEARKLELTHSPVFAAVARFANMPASIAVGKIKQLRRELKEYQQRLGQVASAVRGADSKPFVVDFTRSYAAGGEEYNG